MTDVVLVIPGLDGDPSLMQRLPWPESYRVIVHDHRLDGADGGLDGMADRALAQIDAEFGPHVPFVLFGESFGGTIALTLARRYPERIRALLLMSTYGWYPHPNRALVRLGLTLWRLLGDRVAHLVLYMGRLLSPIVEFKPGAIRLIGTVAPPDLAAFRAKCDLVLDFDARQWLTELRCPTLVMTGSFDLVVPSVAGRRLAQWIPGAHWRTLAGGHIAHISRPEPARLIIAQWLEELADRGAASVEARQCLQRLVPDHVEIADEGAGRATVAPADDVLNR
jgi:pimeloyl-ACP methyl ester carboxylesterase